MDEKLGSFENPWKNRGSPWIAVCAYFLSSLPSFFFLFKDLEKKKKRNERRRRKLSQKKTRGKTGGVRGFLHGGRGWCFLKNQRLSEKMARNPRVFLTVCVSAKE